MQKNKFQNKIFGLPTYPLFFLKKNQKPKFIFPWPNVMGCVQVPTDFPQLQILECKNSTSDIRQLTKIIVFKEMDFIVDIP